MPAPHATPPERRQSATQRPPSQRLPAAQATPQAPQAALLASVDVSQPLAALMSQSAKEAAHDATPHAPAAQAAVALAGAQRASQAPQWATLVRVSTHEPPQHDSPAAQRSEAAQPGAQAWSTQRDPSAQAESSRQPSAQVLAAVQ